MRYQTSNMKTFASVLGLCALLTAFATPNAHAQTCADFSSRIAASYNLGPAPAGFPLAASTNVEPCCAQVINCFENAVNIAGALVLATVAPMLGALWLAFGLAEQDLALGLSPRVVDRLAAVPGILATSRPLMRPAPRLRDLAAAILAELGVDGFPAAARQEVR